ncbi:hypothetical protein ACFE04_010879 [Oxalis oulophora]
MWNMSNGALPMSRLCKTICMLQWIGHANMAVQTKFKNIGGSCYFGGAAFITDLYPRSLIGNSLSLKDIILLDTRLLRMQLENLTMGATNILFDPELKNSARNILSDPKLLLLLLIWRQYYKANSVSTLDDVAEAAVKVNHHRDKKVSTYSCRQSVTLHANFGRSNFFKLIYLLLDTTTLKL